MSCSIVTHLAFDYNVINSWKFFKIVTLQFYQGLICIQGGILYVRSLHFKQELGSNVKGRVIMDVTNVEQAKIAEDAGAVAVMALNAFRRTSAKKAALHACRTQK